MNQIVDDPEALKAAVGRGKVMALYRANWCPFCRAFKPVFDRLAAAQTGWEPLDVVVDDEDGAIWTDFGIDVVPTVVFYEGGKPVRRLDGKAGIGLREQDLAAALK